MKQHDNINERDLLKTEQQNPVSKEIDTRSVEKILQIINDEDKKVAFAVGKVLPEISQTVKEAVAVLKSGGRIIYLGAGTSGRLGVLDAAEIPPTFSAPDTWFQGIIAGGREALVRSIEGAEDHPENAVEGLKAIALSDRDLLIGIASSSTTPYVIEGLRFARKRGAATVFIICNPDPLKPVPVDILIPVDIGSEIITGSTRMKSGTATKLILNSISTATMIKLGKVFDNLMVDLMVTNKKLEDRGKRIISRVTGVDYDTAGDFLRRSHGSVKSAIVMVLLDCNLQDADRELAAVDGHLRLLLDRRNIVINSH